jgi:hypothetical protein
MMWLVMIQFMVSVWEWLSKYEHLIMLFLVRSIWNSRECFLWRLSFILLLAVWTLVAWHSWEWYILCFFLKNMLHWILMALTMKNTVFCVMTLYSSEKGRPYGGTYHFHFYGQIVRPSSELYGVTTQKTCQKSCLPVLE